MSLTERRILSQVTALPAEDAINVQWLDQVLRDGEVIASTPHRKAYSRDQLAEFLAEVEEGGAAYAAAMGWADPQ